MDQVQYLSPEHQRPQRQVRLRTDATISSRNGELATCVLKNILCISSLLQTNKSRSCGEIVLIALCCCCLLLSCKHRVRQSANTSSCKRMLHVKDCQDICKKDNRDLDKTHIIVSDTWKQICLWSARYIHCNVFFLYFSACYLFSFEGQVCISFQTVSALFHMFYSSWIMLICITTFLI